MPGQILSSANIIIVFSTQSFVGTPNFMFVACPVWPELTLNFAIYLEKKKLQMLSLY